MTAEVVEVHVGGEVSSPKDMPNGNANADTSCVFVNGNGIRNGDVGSGDPAGTDLNYNSVELNGKRIVEESKQSPINNEGSKFEAEKQESLVLVCEGVVDQENEHVNLSDKEVVLGYQSIYEDQNFEADAVLESVVVDDSVDGHEAVPQGNYSYENAESSHVDLPADTVCENGAVDLIHEIPVANSPEELRSDIEQNTEATSCPVADADIQLDSEVVSGSVAKESERCLDTGHPQYGVSETVVDDLVDPRQETAELLSIEIAESFPSQIDSENVPVESVHTDLDVAVSVSDTTAKPDAGFRDSSVTESSTSCEVDDVKRDTEVGKLNVENEEISDSHHVDNADVIEVDNGPTEDDSASGCPNSDAKSEIETGFDSVETEEKVSTLASDELNRKPEVSKRVIEGVDEQPFSVDNAAGESCTSDSVEKESTADVKAESEIENASVVSFRDLPGDDAVVSESDVVSGSVTSAPVDVHVENGGIQSTGVENDDKKCKEVEECVEIQFSGGESDDLAVKELEENGGIQFSGGERDDKTCQEVEENRGIQFTGGVCDDKTCQEVEENRGIQFTGGKSDDKTCQEVEENGGIKFTGEKNDDKICLEVKENGGIRFTSEENDDKTRQEVEENGGILFTGGESDDKTYRKVEGNGGFKFTTEENDDKTFQEVEENRGIQFTGGENDDKTCQEVEENGRIRLTGEENGDKTHLSLEVKENGGTKFTFEENDDKTCLEVKENGGIQFTGGEGGDGTGLEVEGIDGSDRGETQTSTPEGSTVDASESQNAAAEVVKRPFYYLIKVPRYDDENLKEQIKSAQSKVDEKTRSRDAIRDEIHTIRATYKEYAEKLEAAISEERAALELLKSKRQYIDSVLAEITKVKNAISVVDIDGRIRNMEHMIAHETLHLKEEKQFIRDIKQLKQLREQFSSGMGKQDEVQQAVDQKDKLEEQLKLLRKEADSLRENVMKSEAATQAVKKKHREESEKLKRLLGQFKAADEIRQEAYKHLQSLKKQAYEKNKQFWKYKDDAKQAYDLVFKKEREALQHLCVNQVERVLELWNNNDEFRKEYINSNIRSTLRRLKTLDGRSLGPDEEAPVILPVVYDRVAKNISLPQISAFDREKTEQIVPAKSEKGDDKPIPEVQEKKNQTAKSKKPAKPSRLDNVSATVSGRDDEIEEAKEEESKIAKEEEEMARKAEEKRKEEEAAKLREQRRLEEKAKAQEALERKKRIAEKAQARAALRAQKEAEQKEKEREKRARKKEKRKASATEDTAITNEEESSESLETPLEVPQSSELRDKPTKKPKKASQFSKQAKVKSIPIPLRNRGKRRMQLWMWILIAVMVVLGLFLLGNNSNNFSFRSGLKCFGF